MPAGWADRRHKATSDAGGGRCVTKTRIAVFMGTRPEAVKLAPVVAALRGAGDFRCSVVDTGQHKEMFRQVAETFRFTVDSDLDVMRLAGLSARLMETIDGWLGSSQPDMALVKATVLVALLLLLVAFSRGGNRRLATPLVALH